MTKIKICGLRTPSDIQAVNKLKPDYIGLVFADSKRRVTIEEARALKQERDNDISAVGVFVNAPLDIIVNIAEQKIIDIIQLHGTEDALYIKELRSKTEVPLIKAIPVTKEGVVEKLEKIDCDFYLFDTMSKMGFGGTGETFALECIGNLKITKPFFIAGGLNAMNVQTIIQNIHPYGVDVSGGVEIDGQKNYDQIKKFIENGRRME